MNIRYPIYEGVYRILTLERITHQRKEKTTVIVSVVADTEPSRRWMA